MLMNALCKHCRLQHLKIHCHKYCPKLDQDLFEQNKQKVWVLLLHHKELLEHKVLIPDVIDVSTEERDIVTLCKAYGYLSVYDGSVNIARYNACGLSDPIEILRYVI